MVVEVGSIFSLATTTPTAALRAIKNMNKWIVLI